MSGKLQGAIAYLAGAITYDSTDGITWREELKKKVRQSKLGIKFYDPCNKPKGLGSEVGLEKSTVQEWKRKSQFNKVQKAVRKYRRIDLRMVDNSHFLIIYIDTDVFTLGSIDELITAERMKHPVFAIVKQGKKKAPDWLFAIVKSHKEIFENSEELVAYLKKLDSGEIKMDDRWVLYNGKII